MLRIWSLCIVLCKCFTVYAGDDNYPVGARSAGVAGASVACTDIWSSSNNQAGLGYLDKLSAAIYYENRLNVKGLSLQSGCIAIPVKATVIGLDYRYFGYSLYNESKFGLAVSRRLWERFSLGVQMDYFHTHFGDDYGNFGALSAEIGLLCEPLKNLRIGTHVFNISQTKQSAKPDEYIPTIIRFGVSYTFFDKATIMAETEKDIRMKAIFKGGLEFKPVNELYLRCGISNGLLNQYSFGIGYWWKHFTLDIAFSHHKYLGYSPHISISTSL